MLQRTIEIIKRPFFIDFDESVTDQPTDGRTDGRTDQRTDKASYRDARTHLKMLSPLISAKSKVHCMYIYEYDKMGQGQ